MRRKVRRWRAGDRVECDGLRWQVLAPGPEPRTFWLGRRTDVGAWVDRLATTGDMREPARVVG